MPDPTKPMTAADEARAWIERLARFADECNIENETNPIPEENCPPTHVSAAVRLKPLPDGRVSVHEPGVEVTPDRLQAFLAEHDEQRDRADEAEAELAEARAWMADPYNRVRITPVVKRAYRQRDEAVEAAEAEVEEYKADLKAAHAELERLRGLQATLVDGGTYTASQLNRIARIVQHADLLHHHVVEAGSGEDPPTLDSVIHAIQQILIEDEPVKDAWIIVWRELIGGMTLGSEKQLREMAERDRDDACAELERIGGMTSAELLAWRVER